MPPKKKSEIQYDNAYRESSRYNNLLKEVQTLLAERDLSLEEVYEEYVNLGSTDMTLGAFKVLLDDFAEAGYIESSQDNIGNIFYQYDPITSPHYQSLNFNPENIPIYAKFVKSIYKDKKEIFTFYRENDKSLMCYLPYISGLDYETWVTDFELGNLRMVCGLCVAEDVYDYKGCLCENCMRALSRIPKCDTIIMSTIIEIYRKVRFNFVAPQDFEIKALINFVDGQYDSI